MALRTTYRTRRTGAYRLRTLPPRRRGTGPLHDLLDDVVEDGGVELVDDLLSVTLGENEPGVAEHAEVPGDRGPRRRKVFGDFTRCARSVAQELEDVAARGVGECAEDGLHVENVLDN